MTATGSLTTNGVGGVVRYEWVRVYDTGRRIVVNEPPIVIAAGDRSLHAVVTDRWTPPEAGTEQLVFLAPSAPVLPVQSWSCVG